VTYYIANRLLLRQNWPEKGREVLQLPRTVVAAKLTRYVGDESAMESDSSLQLQFPEESPTKTSMEVAIYFPRRKSRRLSILPLEGPDTSSTPSRIHDAGPSLQGAVTVGSSKTTITTVHQSGLQNSTFLPSHLHSWLNAQKRAILRTLQRSSAPVDESDKLFAVNEIATRQLADLIEGTVIRAEGNSCILLGPRGSGKSRVSGFLPLITPIYFIACTAD
jgi:origin recognition complex subunit 4